MMTFLSYDLNVAILIAVFYIFYRLLLSEETFHRMNRIVLLSTAILSFVLPLCIITTHRTEIIPMIQPAIKIIEDGTDAIQKIPEPSQPWWHTTLTVLYLIGVAIVLCKILISLFSILRLIHCAQDVREYKGSRLIIRDTKTASFSWMNNIIIGRDDYEQGFEEILDHEKAHIGLRHSWDIMLVDLISAIQWFNPAIWMLRSDLRTVHEYEADEVVFLKGVDVRHYQYLLVSKAMADSGFSITNQFNHSNLKSRINMMSKKKSNRSSLFKVLYILPVIGVSLAVSAKTIVDYQYEETSENLTDSRQAALLTAEGEDVQFFASTISENQDSINPTSTQDDVVEILMDGKMNDEDAKISVKTTGDKLPLVVLNGKAINESVTHDTNSQIIVRATDIVSILKNYGITPDEIESLTVLKDKASLAIWGEKGKNGVIEIKTKSGAKPDAEKENADIDEDEVFQTVEQMPEFQGGLPALLNYLASNLKYPELAKKLGVGGRVVVQFVIDKTGNVSNCNAISFNGHGDTEKYIGGTTKDGTPLPSPDDKEKFFAACEKAHQQMQEEAIRCIKLTNGHWQSGKQHGKNVAVQYTLPVSFRLN